MANIEYGSTIEFEDLYHCYVNREGQYNIYGQSEVIVISDTGAPANYCWCSTSVSNARSNIWFYLGDKWTFSSWAKVVGGAFGNARSNFFGFIHANDSAQKAYSRGICLDERAQDYTHIVLNPSEDYSWNQRWQVFYLPEGEALNTAFHHIAVTNDGTTQYYFFDGKMWFSETLHDPYNTELYCVPSNNMYRQDYFLMKGTCLWTEDFKPPTEPLYEMFTMKNIGSSGWIPPQPVRPNANILKVY